MKDIFVKIKKGLNRILSSVAAVLLVAMTILVLYQVFTRYVLNAPADFTEELVRYLLIWTGFIGAAYAFSTREHMALIFVRDKMPGNARKWLMAAIDALVLAFAFFVMVIGGFKLSFSTMIELSSLLGIPRGIVYMMAPISGVFITIIQIINIWEDLTGISLSDEK